MVTRAETRASPRTPRADQDGAEADVVEDMEDGESFRKGRRELPPQAVAVLRAWLVSPEHFHHPYPTTADQEQLMHETGIDKKQLKNWFTNARRRIWKPLVSAGLHQLAQQPQQDHRHNAEMRAAIDSPSFFDTLLDDNPGAASHADDFDDECDESADTARNRCAFCARHAVDTQLMPCRHLFHGQCLRPWLEATVTTPSCPVCSVPIANCVLAAAFAAPRTTP